MRKGVKHMYLRYDENVLNQPFAGSTEQNVEPTVETSKEQKKTSFVFDLVLNIIVAFIVLECIDVKYYTKITIEDCFNLFTYVFTFSAIIRGITNALHRK